MTREDGKCKFTLGHPNPELEFPFQLTPEEREAISIYLETVSFSGVDAAGLPSIEKLDFVLRTRGIDPDGDEFFNLKQRLLILTNKVRKHHQETSIQ